MRRTPALLLAAAVLIALVSPALALAPSRHAGPMPASTTTWVTLPTGQRVAVTTGPGGRSSATLARRATPPGAYSTFSLRGDLYVLPHAAVAQLGTRYGLAQFDVSALARGGTARQASQGPVASPAFRMETLTLNGINAAGHPDNDDLVVLSNVDNLAKYSTAAFFFHGKIKLSVPAGHYCAVATFTTTNRRTGAFGLQLVTLPQFTVAGPTSVTLDARSATVPVTVSAPLATTQLVAGITYDRGSARGGDSSDGFSILGSGSITAAPSAPVTIGKVHYYSQWTLGSPPGAGPYYYNLEFPSNGVIPSEQTHVVTNDQLATASASYYSEVKNRPGDIAWFSFLPWQTFAFSFGFPLAQPVQQTEYYSAAPGLRWESSLTALFILTRHKFVDAGNFTSPLRAFTPGQQLSLDFMKEPIHPGVAGIGSSGLDYVCPLCREQGMLDLAVYPFEDNAGNVAFPDGTGVPGLTENDAFTLVSNGALLASGSDPLGTSIPVPDGPATYKLTYDITRSSHWFRMSTQTDSTWSFRSGNGVGGPLPNGWLCGFDFSTDCTVEPLLMPSYNLPTDLLGDEAAGPTSFTLDVGAFAGAPSVNVSSATVQVSFDGGANWSAATVTPLGADQFMVSYTNPTPAATGTLAALRVHAAGGTSSVTQTILQAYGVTG